ncbi:HAD family hydrolase [uncultured Pseudokineococcus sp.]|uniref:HAD family hydrolase n=1 Tax=uncultured Pseudokineococcus sp. TaxID=1642928 RepID=UPI002629CC5A|nr:HAD family hydrolase [uncultured Pseudokineococcus sp.]
MPSSPDDRPADDAADSPGAGVLLDVDGTLLDTNFLHVVAWSRALRAEDVHGVPMAVLHRAIGLGSSELVRRVLGDGLGSPGSDAVDDDLVEAVTSGHSEQYGRMREEVEPFPRAADLIDALAQRDLAVVLATSGDKSDLDWMLPAVGAGDELTGVLTSGDVEAAKPAPDIFGRAAEAHGLDPSRCVAVGDTVWDVESAGSAGMPCIALTCGGSSREELLGAGAAAVYRDPADLLENLDGSPVGELLRTR